MKQIFVILMTMLISISTSAFDGTKIITECNMDLTNIVIPDNITLKQTVTFNDGKTICLYYQKKGNVCKLFSTVDISRYKESDLRCVKSTNFEIVDKVKGKCYFTCKTSDVISFTKNILRQFG